MYLERSDYLVKEWVGRRKQNWRRNEKKYKENEDQCQWLQYEVTSLRSKVIEEDVKTEELKERTGYCEGLEENIVSLKVDLEKSNKKNEELF